MINDMLIPLGSVARITLTPRAILDDPAAHDLAHAFVRNRAEFSLFPQS